MVAHRKSSYTPRQFQQGTTFRVILVNHKATCPVGRTVDAVDGYVFLHPLSEFIGGYSPASPDRFLDVECLVNVRTAPGKFKLEHCDDESACAVSI